MNEQQIAAVRQALEWYDSGAENRDEFASMIKRILEQQPADEPVAWLCRRYDGLYDVLTDSTCKDCFPVYPRPQPAAQYIEHCLWARNGNTPCPHTKPAAWVSLTKEDAKKAILPLCANESVAERLIETSMDEYLAIEAKLREKNGGNHG